MDEPRYTYTHTHRHTQRRQQKALKITQLIEQPSERAQDAAVIPKPFPGEGLTVLCTKGGGCSPKAGGREDLSTSALVHAAGSREILPFTTPESHLVGSSPLLNRVGCMGRVIPHQPGI